MFFQSQLPAQDYDIPSALPAAVHHLSCLSALHNHAQEDLQVSRSGRVLSRLEHAALNRFITSVKRTGGAFYGLTKTVLCNFIHMPSLC